MHADEQARWKATRAALADAFKARATALGWIDARGRIKKRHGAEALSFVIGYSVAFEALRHPDRSGLAMLAFMAAVRGASEADLRGDYA